MKIEDIARVCHEVNRTYCQATGDLSQVSWEEAPQWQKDSAIAGVEYVLANPNATPEQSHASWLAQKRADGWTWGPKKDPEKKEHPCFIQYSRLPTEQRVKDYLFLAVCRMLGQDSPADVERDVVTGVLLNLLGGSVSIGKHDIEAVEGMEIVRVTRPDGLDVTYRLRRMKSEDEAVIISIPAA